MPRFFADSSQIGENSISLSEPDMRHIRSLRLRVGESFTICDGNKTDYICRLSAGEGIAEIERSLPTRGEPEQQCRIFAAFSKGERMEYVVQKAIELGAYEIVLFPSARCVAKYDNKTLPKRLERWSKISLEAAKQCGRGIIPRVRAAESYTCAIDEAANSAAPLYFYELADSVDLRTALSGSESLDSVSIVTGPEGGFEPEETEYAETKGMRIVTLGTRILRCETAPVAVLAAIMYHTGNL